MSNRTCPYCKAIVADGLKACPTCGWRPPPGATSFIIPILVVMFLVLLLSANCSYQSYTAPRGDEYGYGGIALGESAIAVLSIVWLCIALSTRMQVGKHRAVALVRSTAGLALGGVAFFVGLSQVADQPGLEESAMRSGLMAAGGLGLLISSLITLKAQR